MHSQNFDDAPGDNRRSNVKQFHLAPTFEGSTSYATVASCDSVARAARVSRGIGSSARAHLSRSSVSQAHSQLEA